MIRKLWLALASIRNYQRIPRLPRGMLASHYTHMTREERDVLARIGARDPAGIKVAMRRAGVTTIKALKEKLEHYRPERNINRRWWTAVQRVAGGVDHDPHRKAIIQATRIRRSASDEIERRVKINRKIFGGD